MWDVKMNVDGGEGAVMCRACRWNNLGRLGSKLPMLLRAGGPATGKVGG